MSALKKKISLIVMQALNPLIFLPSEFKKTGRAEDNDAALRQHFFYHKGPNLHLGDREAIKQTNNPPPHLSAGSVCAADTYPRASLCEEAGSVCVIRTVRGVGGGDVSHLMVALSSRPSSSTAAI